MARAKKGQAAVIDAPAPVVIETTPIEETEETEETVEETIEETAPIEDTEIEETDTAPSDLPPASSNMINVTLDMTLEVCESGDLIRFLDYKETEMYTMPAALWKAIGARTKRVYIQDFIERNAPVIIPEVSDWLLSHGLDPSLTDTGRCNGESRLFERVDSYIAINRDGSINGQAIPKAALEVLGITIEQRSKAVDWAAWLGIGKKKTASAGIGGQGGKIKTGQYVGQDKSKRGVQNEKQDRFVAWMMDGYHSLAEIQAYLEVAENTARDHLSYIRYWGCELEKVNRDGVKVYRITADNRPARG